MNIRSVQFDIVHSVQQNIETALALAGAAPLDEVDVLLFPELFTTGFQLPRLAALAVTAESPAVERFRAFAARHKVNIVLGSIALRNPGGISNTTLVIDRTGGIISRYDKLHLFKLMQEEQYLIPGNAPHAFTLDGIPATSIICYDLRFPELTRSLYVQHRPFVVFVPMEWPAPRTEAFRVLLRARAIENQCFVVSCNRVGSENGSVFEGASMAVDPYGTILAELDAREGVLDVRLDMRLVEQVRTRMTCRDDRRPDIIG